MNQYIITMEKNARFPDTFFSKHYIKPLDGNALASVPSIANISEAKDTFDTFGYSNLPKGLTAEEIILLNVGEVHYLFFDEQGIFKNSIVLTQMKGK